MDFKEHWTLDTALKIVQNQTVDSRLWAEAVEWLLLYGPPEIVTLLLQASHQATDNCFPELQAADYTPDGQPCYDIAEIARSLGMSEKEALEIIAKKEALHRSRSILAGNDPVTIH